MKKLNFAKLNKFLRVNGVKNKKIIEGDYFYKTINYLRKKFPFGKICFIYSKELDSRIIDRLNSCLSAVELKCVKFLLEEKAIYDILDCAKISKNLEGVRAILTFEHSLLEICKYISFAGGLELVYGAKNAQVDNLFEKRVTIKINELPKIINIDYTLTTIIDRVKISNEFAGENYLSAVKNVISYVDLAINLTTTEQKLDAKIINIAQTALKNSINVFEKPKDEQAKYILTQTLWLEAVNYLLDNYVGVVSGLRNAELFYKACYNKKIIPEVTLNFVKLLCGLYSSALSQSVVFEQVDYFALSSVISGAVDISSNQILKKITRLKQDYQKLLGVKRGGAKINKLLHTALSNADKINSTYIALGGKTSKASEELIVSVKAGALLGEFNLACVLLEKGLFNLISGK